MGNEYDSIETPQDKQRGSGVVTMGNEYDSIETPQDKQKRILCRNDG